MKEDVASSIVEAILRNARVDADRVACVIRKAGAGDEALTRGDLWHCSCAFARRLTKSGVEPETPFLIALGNRSEMIYAFFGAMIAGLIPAFMPFPTSKQNPVLFWKSHQDLFRLIDAKHFLTFAANSELTRAVPDGATVLHVEDIADWFVADETAADTALPTPDTTALLQHTSGTTGLKKGVMLSHSAILAQVGDYAARIGFGPDDVVASWLPLYHDMGLIACLVMSVVVGARLVLLDPFEWTAKPMTLLDCIETERATFSWLPNFAFLHLARTAVPGRRWDLSSMKAFINCSEPCKVASFERFTDRFATCGLRPHALQVCYAMAENVFAVTQTEMGTSPRAISIDAQALESGGRIESPGDGPTSALLSCGRPIANAAVSIRGVDGQPLGPGQVGEIAIKTRSLFTGYNRMPEATSWKIVDGWYHTGDLGFLDDGELFVTGRKDDLMIVYGRNYYAHALEEAASVCQGVVPGRVVAFAVDNEETGSRDAVLLVEGDGTCEEKETRRAVKAKVFDSIGLTLYTVRVYPRGTLIKSTAGKISRDQNKRFYLQQTGAA